MLALEWCDAEGELCVRMCRDGLPVAVQLWRWPAASSPSGWLAYLQLLRRSLMDQYCLQHVLRHLM
jgi:hypothetical protein